MHRYQNLPCQCHYWWIWFVHWEYNNGEIRGRCRNGGVNHEPQHNTEWHYTNLEMSSFFYLLLLSVYSAICGVMILNATSPCFSIHAQLLHVTALLLWDQNWWNYWTKNVDVHPSTVPNHSFLASLCPTWSDFSDNHFSQEVDLALHTFSLCGTIYQHCSWTFSMKIWFYQRDHNLGDSSRSTNEIFQTR